MNKFLLALSTTLLLLSSCQSKQEKEIALVNDFFERVLSYKPMTDKYLEKKLSPKLLKDFREEDNDDMFWMFRSGKQDDPSTESSVESVEPDWAWDGWYIVTYSDMGHPRVAHVAVEDGRIAGYYVELEREKEGDAISAICRYMTEMGESDILGERCIPYCLIVGTEEEDPDDILVWGDFWVENYTLSGDTLHCVSGGSHPGCMHVQKADDGFEVTQFDAVGDGSDFNPTAKAIFGDRYDAFMSLRSNEDAKRTARARSILDYAEAHDLDISYYQDYGWPAVKIKE